MFPAIRRAAVGAAVALSIITPAAVADVNHVSVDAKGPNGRTLIAPGDDITLRETIANAGLTPLNGVMGVLTASTSGVTTDPTALPFTSVESPGSSTIGVGGSGFNATPFAAHVPSGLECGTPLRFNVALNDGTQGNVNFTVGTGIPGPVSRFDAPAGAVTLPDGGTASSSIDVPTSATIKDLRVHVASLTHQRISDMRLTLVDPDGVPVMLMDRGQASGANLTDTVFATAGPGIGTSSAPHTGSFRAKGPLSSFIGRDQRGLWTLELVDAVSGNPGTAVLDGWWLETNPPVCNATAEALFSATPNPVAKDATATFDATSSQDPDGTARHYVWDFGDGTTVDGGLARTATHTYAIRGAKRVTLTMQDNSGLTLSQSSSSVLVDRAPVAALTGPASVASVDAPITLDASGTTADSDGGSIVRYEWDLGDGVFRPAEATTTPGKSFDFYRAGIRTAGPHTVRVRAIDDIGASDIKSLTIDVANLPPTAAFTAPTGYVASGRSLTLDAGASADHDGTIAGYQWDLDGDGTADTPVLPGPTTTFTPPGPGHPNVTLTVIDDKGARTTVAHIVDVTAPPTVTITQPPAQVGRNVAVTLDTAGSADPDGTIASWEWDLDGDNAYEVQPPSGQVGPTMQTVSFSTFATHLVRVRATDDHGVSTVVTVPVVVANRPPVARLTATPGTVTTGSPVTLDASGSTDSDGSIVQYRFDLDADNSFETVGTSPVATMSYPNAGHVDVRVQVVDSDGGTAIATAPVTVTAPVDPGTGGSGGSRWHRRHGRERGHDATERPDVTPGPGHHRAGPRRDRRHRRERGRRHADPGAGEDPEREPRRRDRAEAEVGHAVRRRADVPRRPRGGLQRVADDARGGRPPYARQRQARLEAGGHRQRAGDRRRARRGRGPDQADGHRAQAARPGAQDRAARHGQGLVEHGLGRARPQPAPARLTRARRPMRPLAVDGAICPVTGSRCSATMRRDRFSDEGGFTLPELLVVVLIIGILAAISLTVFLRQQGTGQDGSAKAAARELVSLVETCAVEKDGDYRQCDTAAQLGPTGLSFGAQPGDVEVTTSARSSYTVRAHSRSGNWFDISRADAGMEHACGTPASGGCHAGGAW